MISNKDNYVAISYMGIKNKEEVLVLVVNNFMFSITKKEANSIKNRISSSIKNKSCQKSRYRDFLYKNSLPIKVDGYNNSVKIDKVTLDIVQALDMFSNILSLKSTEAEITDEGYVISNNFDEVCFCITLNKKLVGFSSVNSNDIEYVNNLNLKVINLLSPKEVKV